MLVGVLAARSLIVVRCFRIAVARCMLSSPFSSVVFLRYWFVSFGVGCTLFALHCSHFADDSMLLATPFLFFAFGYRLFASRCSILFLANLALVSRYSPAGCSLRIIYSLLHPARYSLLATHATHGTAVASLFSPRVVRWSLYLLADCSSLLAVCYSLLTT